MSATPVDVEVYWNGTCRHCSTEWEILDEVLREYFPSIPADARALIADCSCGKDVDLDALTVKTFGFGAWDVLPPESGCPECGTEHPVELPHDLESLVYQYSFRNREARAGREERWPTWIDAMAHCTEQMREDWIAKMAELGFHLNEDGTITEPDTPR